MTHFSEGILELTRTLAVVAAAMVAADVVIVGMARSFGEPPDWRGLAASNAIVVAMVGVVLLTAWMVQVVP